MIVAVAAIGSAAGGQAAPSAHPDYGFEPVSVKVKMADLDLANPAGAAVGLRRIHQAAKEICGPDVGFAPIEVQRIYRACIDDAVNRAVDRLGNPLVSALNSGGRSAVMASNGH